MSGSHLIDPVVRFLSKIPPFQFLPRDELVTLARAMSLEYFPRDTVILRAGEQASGALHVIQKGAVKLAIRTNVGKELVLDARAEGEVFGVLSFLGRDVARLDAIAVEDTLCYTLPATEAQSLLSRHPEVSEFFLRTSLTRYMDHSLRELREQTQLMGGAERLLYTLSAGDVAEQAAITCRPEATAQEAGALMARHHAACVFVGPEAGPAQGVITTADLARKIVGAGRSPATPVSVIMTAPVVSVERSQPVFEALLEMVSHDIRQALVTANGLPHAVLTIHDLLLLQGKSPLSVVRHIERQQTLGGLAAAHQRVADLLPLLLREGARANHITRVFAQISDRVMGRILEFAEQELGPPPAPYCWITFGSEGRLEQTFKTDQDNALILADGVEKDPAASEYFRRFAEFCRDALSECGYPECPGGYMASNPKWRKPLAEWQAMFTKWVDNATVLEVQAAVPFLDIRPVGGSRALFDALQSHIRTLLAGRGSMFLSVLAYVSLNLRPPTGFFRRLIFEPHKSAIELKLTGTGPIVNVARIFALAHGGVVTNTDERLQFLIRSEVADPVVWNDLREAFEFLMMLRLDVQRKQANDRRPAADYDNLVDPQALTHLQRALLKEAFQAAARGQSLMEEKFRNAIWPQLALQAGS